MNRNVFLQKTEERVEKTLTYSLKVSFSSGLLVE